jgi:hypothetical protein
VLQLCFLAAIPVVYLAEIAYDPAHPIDVCAAAMRAYCFAVVLLQFQFLQGLRGHFSHLIFSKKAQYIGVIALLSY